MNLEWHRRGACRDRDPDSMFADAAAEREAAKRVCTGCEVRTDCLEWALGAREPFGIWGGLTHLERRRHLDDGKPIRTCTRCRAVFVPESSESPQCPRCRIPPTTTRARPPKLGGRRGDVQALAASGLSDPQIAERLGCSPQAVWSARNRWGIPAAVRRGRQPAAPASTAA